MNKYLIIAVILLSACCDEKTKTDCDQNELAEIDDVGKPHFVSEKDGVKLYWTKPCVNCREVYFTTPCGDVSWSHVESSGKTSTTYDHQVNGQGCK